MFSVKLLSTEVGNDSRKVELKAPAICMIVLYSLQQQLPENIARALCDS